MVSLLVSAGLELGEPKDLIITVYQAAHTVNGKSGPDAAWPPRRKGNRSPRRSLENAEKAVFSISSATLGVADSSLSHCRSSSAVKKCPDISNSAC